MKPWALLIFGCLLACGGERLHPLYCLHQVYRLENENQEFDVYWVEIGANRFLAVYDDPWKRREPGDVSLDTRVTSIMDDHLWIGPRLHSLKYRIERWHRLRIERADCWCESPTTIWIRAARGDWIVARQQRDDEFHAEIVSQGPQHIPAGTWH